MDKQHAYTSLYDLWFVLTLTTVFGHWQQLARNFICKVSITTITTGDNQFDHVLHT